MFSGIDKRGVFIEANLVVSAMETTIFQVKRTQIILRQRYKGEFRQRLLSANVRSFLIIVCSFKSVITVNFAFTTQPELDERWGNIFSL